MEVMSRGGHKSKTIDFCSASSHDLIKLLSVTRPSKNKSRYDCYTTQSLRTPEIYYLLCLL